MVYNYEPRSLPPDAAEDFTLINYAARYWPAHYHAITPETGRTTLDALATSLFDTSRGSSFINWVKIFDPHCDRETLFLRRDINPDFEFLLERKNDDEPQPLFYASMIGLRETVMWLLGRDGDASAEDK